MKYGVLEKLLVYLYFLKISCVSIKKNINLNWQTFENVNKYRITRVVS